MRIAWLVYGDLGQPTGGYVYDRIVVEGLRAAGDEVTIVDPRSSDVRVGVDVMVGDALCVREIGPLFEGTRLARVLLVHHLPSWEIERPDRAALHALEARALRSSDAAIVTSSLTATRLRAQAPALPVTVVPPGADRLPRRLRVEGSGLRLLFVGSLIPRKRVDVLLDAVERVADPRVSLAFIGDAGRDPAYARAIEARVGASPVLRRSVAFHGIADDEALAQAMAAADALVLPSSLEGYGIVLDEALFAGLPVLVSRPAAEAAELVDSPAGCVFDDANGLAGIVARLASDARERAALREAADAVVSARWADAASAFRTALAAVNA